MFYNNCSYLMHKMLEIFSIWIKVYPYFGKENILNFTTFIFYFFNTIIMELEYNLYFRIFMDHYESHHTFNQRKKHFT